ncbi:MAG: chlorophyllase/cutinase-like alpha/beta fold protein [Lachnospiraceae bacterium]|jgi:hypothetical protein
MKKGLKILIIAAAAIAAAAAAFTVYASARQAVPDDYQKKTETGGTIEEKYLRDGSHEVKTFTQNTLSDLKKFEFWYPADLTEKAPVVIFCNGTGVKASRYKAVLRHLASWGFITVGTEEENSFSGLSAEMCMRILEKAESLEQLDSRDNPLCGKIDLDRVGLSGHSQGGVGVINALTDTGHASSYRCAFIASPTNKELADNLLWYYDASKISVPVLLMASTGKTDENMVVNLEQLTEIYDDMAGAPFRAMARRKNADHGDMLYAADGYMTAFFAWQFQGDSEAAGAFTGENAELLSNPQYQDQQIR